jgi:hypothetical protein
MYDGEGRLLVLNDAEKGHNIRVFQMPPSHSFGSKALTSFSSMS